MATNKNNNIFEKTSFLGNNSSEFVEALYADYLNDPSKLPEQWKAFFDGLKDERKKILENVNGPSWSPKKRLKPYLSVNQKETGKKNGSMENYANGADILGAAKDSIRASMLVRAYRIRGHLISKLDPLELQKREEHPELKPETYGFTVKDLNKKVFLDGAMGLQTSTLKEVIDLVKKTYCEKIGYEFLHMGDPEEKKWIRDRIEGKEKGIKFTENGKRAILNKLIEAEGFEKFLHIKFVGTKRFGLDGGESLIPALEQIIKRGGHLGVKEVKIGMPHRGRLNVLANMMQKPYKAIFKEFFGEKIKSKKDFEGDVKYHLGA